MSEITYFVALPFTRSEDGDLIAGEAIECSNAGRAVGEAERLSRTNAGAVAFSRTGDPSIGEFANAKIIREFGQFPPDLFEFAGEEN